MEYHATKSVRIYPTREQYNHIKKINFAYTWTYNWTLDTLYVNPDATTFDLTKIFTRYKHNNPEIRMMVQYQYHQHAIVRAHVAFHRAKKDGGIPKYKTRKRKISFGSDFPPRIKDGNTITLAGLHNLHTSSLQCIKDPKSYTIIDSTPERPFEERQFLLCIHEKRTTNKTQNDSGIVKGIDIGISKPLAVSIIDNSGNVTKSWYDTTSKYKKMVSEINQLKSKMSKMIRGSKRYSAAKRKLNRLYKKLNHSRTHNECILAKNMADDNPGEIVMEKLQTRNLTRGGRRKRYLNRELLFVRPYAAMQAIKRRCEKQGVIFSQTDPKFTSQKCPICNHTSKENRNGQYFACTKCNHSDDADANASLNIAFTGVLLAGRSVNGKSVSLFERREMDPTGRFFKITPAQTIGCQTQRSVGFRFFGEKRHKAKGGHSLNRGT